MKSSKDIIMERLRSVNCPEVDAPVMDFIPTTYPDKLRQYLDILPKIGGSYHLMEAGEDINEVILKEFPDAKNIVSSLPEITCATVNPDTLESSRELADCDVAVVRGKFGVCENGMVWIPQNTRYKALYFVAESLVAIIDRKDLVANMHEAYKHPGFNDFEFGVFIAGPSKTADIEQALVIGAHGARKMLVILT